MCTVRKSGLRLVSVDPGKGGLWWRCGGESREPGTECCIDWGAQWWDEMLDWRVSYLALSAQKVGRGGGGSDKGGGGTFKALSHRKTGLNSIVELQYFVFVVIFE